MVVSVLVSVVDPEPPKSLLQRQLRLEARVGIEPTHRGFADLGLTTWLPRPCSIESAKSWYYGLLKMG